jgi:hypothetical protein
VTAAAQNVPVGIGLGNSWQVTFAAGTSGLDMTTVTGGSFAVTRTYDDSTATWTGTVNAGATTSQCVISVPFTGAEITQPGLYLIAPSLIVGGNKIPATSLSLNGVPANKL